MNNFKELIIKASSKLENSYSRKLILEAVNDMSKQDIANANKLISNFDFNLVYYTYDMVFRATFNTNCSIYLRMGVFENSNTVFYDLDVALNTKCIFTRRAITFGGVYTPFLEFMEE